MWLTVLAVEILFNPKCSEVLDTDYLICVSHWAVKHASHVEAAEKAVLLNIVFYYILCNLETLRQCHY